MNLSTVVVNQDLIGKMTIKTKLPVGRTVNEAYVFVFRNLKPFFTLATIPIILTIILFLVVLARHGGSIPEDIGLIKLDVWHYLGSLANQFIWSVFAVSWHRYYLLGRRDTVGPIQFHVGRRELRFFFYDLIFIVPLIAVTTYLITVSMVIESSGNVNLGLLFSSLAVMFIILFLWARCLLIFPAVAVEDDKGLTIAWTQRRGTTWRLTAAFLVASIPLIILGALIEFLNGVFDVSAQSNSIISWTFNVVVATGQNIVSFLLVTVEITVLSMAFCHNSDWVPPTHFSSRPSDSENITD